MQSSVTKVHAIMSQSIAPPKNEYTPSDNFFVIGLLKAFRDYDRNTKPCKIEHAQ